MALGWNTTAAFSAAADTTWQCTETGSTNSKLTHDCKVSLDSLTSPALIQQEWNSSLPADHISLQWKNCRRQVLHLIWSWKAALSLINSLRRNSRISNVPLGYSVEVSIKISLLITTVQAQQHKLPSREMGSTAVPYIFWSSLLDMPGSRMLCSGSKIQCSPCHHGLTSDYLESVVLVGSDLGTRVTLDCKDSWERTPGTGM